MLFKPHCSKHCSRTKGVREDKKGSKFFWPTQVRMDAPLIPISQNWGENHSRDLCASVSCNEVAVQHSMCPCPFLLSLGCEPAGRWAQSSHCDQEKPEAGQLLAAKAAAHPSFLRYSMYTSSCPLKSCLVWLGSTPGVRAGCPVSGRSVLAKMHFTGSDRWYQSSTCPNQHLSLFLSLCGLSSPEGMLQRGHFVCTAAS